jgi:hypothetical protein
MQAPNPGPLVTRKRLAIYAAIALTPVLIGTALAVFDIWRRLTG